LGGSGSARTVLLNPVSGQSGSATITLTVSDGVLSTSTMFSLLVNPIPRIGGFVFGDGRVQRSMVSQILVDFNTVVTVSGGAFVLERRNDANGTWTTLTASQLTIQPTLSSINNNTQTRATLTFTGTEIVGRSLADGNYRLKVLSNAVSSNGQALDGDGNGTAGGDFIRGSLATDNFFRLYGDMDGSGAVTDADFARLRVAIGSKRGGRAYDNRFDWNDDGQINVVDYNEFRKRLGRTRGF
jgi:hypothetical protein